ncbi:MAG: ABC transporter substrate-binding protein, partial [Actinomycetota bacterium]|nr:ABC transporter substrate-binding protein [Actinomycetota bacterium]
MFIYDSLFWSQVSEDPEPWLAESPTPSPDFRSWTITLRSDVRWHDGGPLTAEDVRFTFDYFRDTAPPGRWTHQWTAPARSGGTLHTADHRRHDSGQLHVSDAHALDV